MPITWLDLILLLVMLVSGLLAMIRGFMREILSIAAWGIAALTTLYSYSRVLPTVQQYFSSNTVATAVTVVSIFLLTLMLVSILTVRISDLILDSRVGALDRTLGFLFGLGPRAVDCRGGLFVFRLAGARPQPAGMGARRQVESRYQEHGRLAQEHVAGRPRKHHLEEVEAAEAGRSGPRRMRPPASARSSYCRKFRLRIAQADGTR